MGDNGSLAIVRPGRSDNPEFQKVKFPGVSEATQTTVANMLLHILHVR